MRDDEGLCVLSGDHAAYATHYGGVARVEVTEEATYVRLRLEAAEAVSLPEVVVISYRAHVLDPAWVQERVDHLLS